MGKSDSAVCLSQVMINHKNNLIIYNLLNFFCILYPKHWFHLVVDGVYMQLRGSINSYPVALLAWIGVFGYHKNPTSILNYKLVHEIVLHWHGLLQMNRKFGMYVCMRLAKIHAQKRTHTHHIQGIALTKMFTRFRLSADILCASPLSHFLTQPSGSVISAYEYNSKHSLVHSNHHITRLKQICEFDVMLYITQCKK